MPADLELAISSDATLYVVVSGEIEMVVSHDAISISAQGEI